MRVATWNVNWASPRSARGKLILAEIERCELDLLVLTETTTELLDSLGGYIETADPDYGYSGNPNRRKVALWSRLPLRDVSRDGAPCMPPGRYVSARAAEELWVVAVCIPWAHAHVSTGRKDRAPWEDHQRYLEGLQLFAADWRPATIVAGDFNQRLPRARQPVQVFEQLCCCFERMQFITEGVLNPIGQQSIDHIAVTGDLRTRNVRTISNMSDGLRLSDHFGVVCDVDL